MCGITGKVSFNQENVRESHIASMNACLVHRGPDDKGVYISKNEKVGLGQQRLAIIDLSPLGHQPMTYMGRYWITFNGEIYNYLEERAELEKAGYTFKSKSDTEVIMALYDKYGDDCVTHLRGMFALAIYDEKTNTLFCARDRLGKKPFKYFLNENVFIFASELKAILSQKEYVRETDYLAIHHYLTLQYCPAPLTGFVGIKKLPPAHTLRVDLNTGKHTIKKYWQLSYEKKLNLTEHEWQERILSKLEESVKMRMISDVPLGAFLSGGIDSSAVVAMMAKNSSVPVKTFSIGFGEKTHNELPFARMVAEKFGTDHKELYVEPNAIEVLPKLVYHYEEPYADSSALPTYYVSKMAREHVTVCLNGDGGDENFAGYTRYSYFKLGLTYQKLAILNKAAGIPLTRLFSKVSKSQFAERAARFTNGITMSPSQRYSDYICYFTNAQKEALYGSKMNEYLNPALNTSLLLEEAFKDSGSNDPLEQAIYADLVTYLPDDLLAKVDIATMITSLEGRSPFLDHEFFELTAQIPTNLKLKGLDNKKYILKKSLESILPHEVMYRPKRGFSIPIAKWLRGELREFTYDHLLSKSAVDRNLFNKEYVQFLLDQHCSEPNANYSSQIWALLTLELWFKQFVDQA